MGAAAVTSKQRKVLELYSMLTMAPQPDVAAMTYDDANKWLEARLARAVEAIRVQLSTFCIHNHKCNLQGGGMFQR
jgi:hypothetical protein